MFSGITTGLILYNHLTRKFTVAVRVMVGILAFPFYSIFDGVNWYKFYKIKNMKDPKLKIASMKDVYKLLLEEGYNVTIDDKDSFITVVQEDFVVCGDDDLITLQGKNDFFTTSSHVISDDDHVYEKVYQFFKDYLDHAKQYTSKKLLNLL